MWLLLIGTLVALIYCYLREKTRHFEKLGVPHVKPWIIVGNVGPNFFRRQSIPDLVRKYYNLFANERYFGFYNFMTPMIIVRDPELIRDIGIKHFNNFTDHMAFMNEDVDKVLSKNLFSLRGGRWRETRSILSPAFTGSKMRGLFNLVNKTADNFNDCLVSNLNLEEDIDAKDVFGRYTTDVIASVAYGIEVNSLLDENNVFRLLGKEAMDIDVWKLLSFVSSKTAPFLAKLFNLRFFSGNIEKFFRDLVKSNVEQRQHAKINRPDMLQLMIQSNSESRTTKLTIDDMTGEAFIFFVGGFDATSTTMCFAAHEIANNPRVQDKLAREVRENYDKIMDKDSGYDNLTGLKYLDAVVRESMRIHAGTYLLDRVCTETFKLPPAHPGAREITVRPGEAVAFPFHSIHRDQEHYSEADKFIPERFLRDDGTVAKDMIDSNSYGPFGIGPRMCIGIRFALMEVKLVLVHLLARCELSPSSRTAYPVEYGKRTAVMTVDDGFWLKLKMRESENNNSSDRKISES